MIKRLLIANRGEIACRIIKTCQAMGIETVAIYVSCESDHRHVQMADDAVCVGDCDVIDGYQNSDNIIMAALCKQCDAIHPGYGFFSEDAHFAKQVRDAGLIFIGPNTEAIALASNKLESKLLCQAHHVPVIEGSQKLVESLDLALNWADKIGYPLMLKSNQGAGGHRIYIVWDDQELSEKINIIQSLGDHGFLEKYHEQAKHVEVQLCADQYGNMIHLGLRDCSLQINQKKVIEETYDYSNTKDKQDQLIADAMRIARALNLDNVFTIEFLLFQDGKHAFIEANPRIQVEHSISEQVTGLDLVRLQIECANKQALTIQQADITCYGHAIECRIVAEDTRNNFLPSEGSILFMKTPICDHVRVDYGVNVKDTVLPHYDHLLMKLIVHHETRQQAMTRLRKALSETIIVGVKTNIEFLQIVLASQEFQHKKTNIETMTKIYQQWQKEPHSDKHDTTCERCHQVFTQQQLIDHHWVCHVCGFHWMISARQTIDMLSDVASFIEMDRTINTNHHHMTSDYQAKLNQAQQHANTHEAIITGVSRITGIDVCLGVFEPRFMMGTMGSVVGEKLTRLIEHAHLNQLPLIVVSASGGARMQEGIESLMQMAKVSLALSRFQKEGGFFISLLTHPTMGGVTASFAMQGDIIIAHPYASIGFSGPRVAKQALHQQFDQQIQQAEVLSAHGWIDVIISRQQLKDSLTKMLILHQQSTWDVQLDDIIVANTTPPQTSTWQIVQQARDTNRVKSNYVIQELFDSYISLQDATIDGALVGGIAQFNHIPVTVIAHQKGDNLKSSIHSRFGMVSPTGHRKIKRLVKQAEKFNRPIITIIDTPGAYPSMVSELTGQATAISDDLAVFSQVNVPVIAFVLSEGGSGGALSLGIADYVYMCNNAYYSVISPEGYASILYRDETKAEEASNLMKITAPMLKQMGIIDEIIIDNKQEDMIKHMQQLLKEALEHLMSLSTKQRLDRRYQRYRQMAAIQDE